ncbi:MAG TPA: L-serine ammonia-lyase [Verrucomicrobiales bacterium]|nr:L-serine ammonia-lyase [Verrucomicrobiales bacterium]
MSLSVLDLFTIGIGPSSSHTVGPMRAGWRFVQKLKEAGVLERTARVEGHLYGSLALTGKGHGSDKAVLLGLEGETPEQVDVDAIPAQLARIRSTQRLRLGGEREVEFNEKTGLIFHRLESLPVHPNGLRFAAFDAAGGELLTKTYYSIGGGFVVGEKTAGRDELTKDETALPFPFRSGAELLQHCAATGLSVSSLMLRNEEAFRPEAETRAALLRVWSAMQKCVERGCRNDGTLPGGLKVARRAPKLFQELSARPEAALHDSLIALDWVSLWAMAVNEENAMGGRVVTAPTNGAAGILPAVLHYLARVRGISSDDAAIRFLLTAGAIGILYKLNASISGAEVGCQGEVGVACSMAAGALCEALGGSPAQVENAAEIGMEHNLGLTCDPIGGLVQIPCIERNAMGAVKAINAARLALRGDGTHTVSLDKVIATMRQTGADMSTKYKETSRGGLAVNVTEC